MKQYLIVIQYEDEKQKQVLAMQDTYENVNEWIKNTLEIEKVVSIVRQQFAIIETVKFEKNEEDN